ncbi:MAG TPA: hypothetical protein VLT59_08900, partial [Steroidobacteraceae bacterium]|nr:hypothetical protein [Steroidobacteraceae bacterium]
MLNRHEEDRTMMIVKERSFVAVLGAFAWLAVVFAWQSDVVDDGPAAARAAESTLNSVAAPRAQRVAVTSAAWYE